MKRLFLLLAALLTAVSANANSCGGEPDMPLLHDMLAGRAPAGSSLYLEPGDFFRLQPAARKALGDGITLCPNVPLNSGKPVIKMKMDFADIWEPMEIAVAAGDWETVELIGQSCTPRPLPGEALFSLLVFPSFDEKTMLRLAKTLGIPLEHAELGYRFFLLDVFFALGGRSPEQEGIYWVSDERQLAKARSAAQARKKDVKFVPYSGMRANQAQRSLMRCGVISVNADHFINNK